jgi:soluble cytochrome b562
MNPFEKAWLLLKMTPEEMEAAGFPEAAQQMREMQRQQQQVSQQAQNTAPQQTPQTQSYQHQIDMKQAKVDEAQRIRAMLKEGRQVGPAREAIQAFYEKHGHYPKKGIPKKIIRRLEALRERDD